MFLQFEFKVRDGLIETLKADTDFLKSVDIMDYSLLIGIEDNLDE